jgi:hypothetical protein
MPTITIPREFFTKERNTVYSTWRFAFWRELIQNAVDAGSTKVDILTETLGEDLKIVFSDNGCGMSEDVLSNVYFSLGKSTKDGSSGIGGFGRARILTCFSMVYYKIWTQDNYVDGSGASYELVKLDERVDGCRLEIMVDGTSDSMMVSHLKDYVRASDLKTTITLNGEEINNISLPLGSHVRDLVVEGEDKSFAKVYVTKGEMDYYMLVRVNGTLMYREYVGVPHRITIELDPERSREILTASRDSLHDKYRKAVAAYRDELTSNTSRAIKSDKNKVKTRSAGSGMIRSVKLVTSSTSAGRDEPAGERHLVSISEMQFAGDVEALRAEVQKIDYLDLSTSQRERLAELMVKNPDIEDSFSPLPSIVFLRNTANEKIISASEKYRPANWRYVIKNGRVVWTQGEEQIRLLMMWKYMCEQAVRALIDSGRAYDVVWSIGWVFEDETLAMADRSADGYHFLVNPINGEGKMRFRLRDASSLKQMMSDAKHEVAHVASMSHNEDFALTLSDIDAHFLDWRVLREAQSLRA